MNTLEELNSLELLPSGVLRHKLSADDDFAYSDGSEIEKYLHTVFEEATDLSSASAELQRKIKDWPSEYHLSPVRANILRGLELQSVNKVLELGCGCGAITRYLAEQVTHVDAIEGSAIRAKLARLRNKNCHNVTVIHANFNYINLPDECYDAIILVGVAEYARKFFPDALTDHDAVITLLNKLRPALSNTGAIYIAIENRVGLKYLLGAHEDHYSLRYVGLDQYRNTAGIRTYDTNEWDAILLASKLESHVKLSVYPDYKLPTVLLGKRYCDENPYAHNHLEGVGITDYTSKFQPTEKQELIVQAMNNSKQMTNVANSFLIIAGKNNNVTKVAAEIDFVQLPKFNRRREYSLITKKLNKEDVVSKKRIKELASDSGTYQHKVHDEPYYYGHLLSALWARDLIIYSQSDRFESWLIKYYLFIQGYKESYHRNLTIDLLPGNIVVSDDGSYRVFDQEWSVDEVVDPKYLYFRALLTFRMTYPMYFKRLSDHHKLYCVDDFINYGFRVIGESAKNIDQYCQQEDDFQSAVSIEPSRSDTKMMLEQVLSERVNDNEYFPRCYWRTKHEIFSDDNSSSVRVLTSPEYKNIILPIPRTLSAIDVLRLDPCDHKRPDDSGYLTIQSIKLLLKKQKQEMRIVWSCDDQEKIIKQAITSNLLLMTQESNKLFVVVGDDPYLEFRIPKHEAWESGDSYELHCKVKFTRSQEYRMARQQYLEHNQSLMIKIEYQKEEISVLHKDKEELEEIKSSKIWHLLRLIVSIIPNRR